MKLYNKILNDFGGNEEVYFNASQRVWYDPLRNAIIPEVSTSDEVVQSAIKTWWRVSGFEKTSQNRQETEAKFREQLAKSLTRRNLQSGNNAKKILIVKGGQRIPEKYENAKRKYENTVKNGGPSANKQKYGWNKTPKIVKG